MHQPESQETADYLNIAGDSIHAAACVQVWWAALALGACQLSHAAPISQRSHTLHQSTDLKGPQAVSHHLVSVSCLCLPAFQALHILMSTL